MSSSQFISHSPEETVAKGREIAAALHPPVIVLLRGDLGSGENYADEEALSSGLGAARRKKTSRVPRSRWIHVFRKNYPVYHVDLYRIENFQDLD